MFFANMGLILSYGLVGTIISFIFISIGIGLAFKLFDFEHVYDDGPNLRDILTMGATFCATDSIAILQLLNQVCSSVSKFALGLYCPPSTRALIGPLRGQTHNPNPLLAWVCTLLSAITAQELVE